MAGDAVARTVQVLRFLREFDRAREIPVRHLREHPLHFAAREMPLGRGCSLHLDAIDVDEAEEPGDASPRTAPLLTVERQRLSPPPPPPDEVAPWLEEAGQDPAREPRVAAARPRSGGSGAPEAFDARPARVAAFDTWRDAWRLWAALERPRRRVQEFYERLYDVHLQLRRDTEDLELVWGTGLFAWDCPPHELLHPLVLARVEIVLDRDRGRLEVIPAAAVPEFAEEMFLGLERPELQEAGRLAKEFRDHPFAPWHRRYVGELLRRMVNVFGARARMVQGPPRPQAEAQISADDLLIVRRRRLGFARDAEEWLRLLQAGEVAPPATVRRIVGAQGGAGASRAEAQRWEGTADALLFPLPANPEQEEIARRLAKHPGVVVQGPPGTGKSHTIANLVSHLLAHGKTILVTSQTERALKVLRDKVAASIRSLCVSVIGSDVEAQEELKRSVQRIIEETGGSRERHAEAAAVARDELARVQRQLGESWSELAGASAIERTEVAIGGQAWTPTRIGRHLSEHEAADGWLPDRVSAEAAWPLAEAELEELYSSLDRVAPDALAEATAELPALEALPTPAELETAVSDRRRLAAALAEAPMAARQWTPARDAPREAVVARMDALRAGLGRAVEALAAFRTPWLQAIGAQVRDPDRRGWWADFRLRLVERRDAILAIRARIGHRAIHIAPDADPRRRERDLEALRAHVARGGGFGPLFGLIRRRLQRARAACRIDGAEPSTLDDLDAILDALRAERLRAELVRLVGVELGPRGGPSLATPGGVPEDDVDAIVTSLASLLTWQEDTWEHLREELRALGFELRAPGGRASEPSPRAPSLALEESPDQLETAGSLLRLLEALALRLEQVGLEEARGDVLERLGDGMRRPGAAAAWGQLKDAVVRDDPAAWAAAHQRVGELWRIRPEAVRLSDLLARVGSVAPRWAATLLEDAGAPRTRPSARALRQAWLWSQLAGWFEDYLAARTPESLRQEMDRLRRRESALIERLVAHSAWANLQVRPQERQALVGWQQTISRIGKGTGKRAPQLRREAQQQMNAARRAVPVWVMPLARVIENFDPSGTPFDVVIVDESSQCDSFGLLALMRAERAIIVGDDNQISPAAVGQRLAVVDALIDRHLEGIPNRHLYDGQQSLYDLATAAFGGVIRLREHFRCVPDIIGFSNALAYSGEIQPLRDATSSDLRPPVVLRPVAGLRAGGSAVNLREAEEVAVLVAACCEHPAYRDATLGVISLLGEAQARAIHERVRRLVSIEELERRSFVAGDAHHFQGDERDVMFLSLVESSGRPRPAVLNRRADLQRFNVAASRARNQMWVVHSVGAEAFHPEDVRARLMAHFASGDARPRHWREVGEILEDRGVPDFRSLVARHIAARGHRVRGEVRAGHYTIDLVVDGDGRSLAVECDGERWHDPDAHRDDAARQMALERIGWEFHRIRGGEFFRDAERSLAGLWRRLDALGIRPTAARTPAAPADPLAEILALAARHRERLAALAMAAPSVLEGHPPAADPAPALRADEAHPG
ncbi:MAG TPA: AAA domain-containing protein [Candidatus Eisenbacteria bacterium]